MTLDNNIKKSFAAGLTAGSLLFSANAIAQQPNICEEVSKCTENTPKKSVKPSCYTQFEGNGMCIQKPIIDAVGITNFKKGYCPGPATNVCADSRTVDDIVVDININKEEIAKLKRQYADMQRSLDELQKSYVLSILSDALKKPVNDLKAFQYDMELNCLPEEEKALPDPDTRACDLSVAAFINTYDKIVEIVGKNLLETEGEKRERIRKFFDKEFLKNNHLTEDNTLKLSLMADLGYQFSALNHSADSEVYNTSVIAMDACLYTPSELFGFCLNGGLFLGATSEGGVGFEKLYHSNLPDEVSTENNGDNGGYSSVNTVKTEKISRRITHGYIGAETQFGGFVSDNWKLSVLGGAELRFGREYETTKKNGVNVLSYKGTAIDANKVHSSAKTDGMFAEVNPELGFQACYDFKESRTCVSGKMGPNFPTGDEEVTFNGMLGISTGIHY